MAQPCNHSISGRVTDKASQPLPGVVVRLAVSGLGTVTDANGNFSIAGICNTADTLLCSTTGFNEKVIAVEATRNPTLNITLAEAQNSLKEVVINGQKVADDLHTQSQAILTAKDLQLTRGETLGELMKNLPGLNSVQTGPSLSKPVIHGLHSNRVLIVNNGVRQEGQQWGTEHAPEIDPFTANKITVIKGAASIRYGADAVAGVVLISPDDLPTTPGIGGTAYLVGTSNGQMGAASASLQGAFGKKLEGLAWRVQGSLKDAGNFSTPNYYLINTGLREGDFSANLGYKWKKLSLNAFYSQYNTKVGIFSGAESGNLAELLAKFAEQRPSTPSFFSYHIDRSYQTVYHDLLKASASYELPNKGTLELTFGRQKDLREEYDELPYNTTHPELLTAPELSFQLITHTLDLIYTQYARNGLSGSIGITGNTSGNVYKGFRYLIPNYRDYNGGAFAIERYNINKLTLEAGVRLDYRWLQVYQRNNTSLQLYNSTYNYTNVTGTVGGIYHFTDHFTANMNIGTAWRAPSINELFINGVHFSDASYDIGDSTLKSERAVNTSLSFTYTSNRFRAVADLYYNQIDNYIYEMPTLKPVTLISGTYPAFVYTQDNVNIKGVDAVLEYDVLPQLTLTSKTTIVRGYNETIHNYLVGMPADRFQNGIRYHVKRIGRAYEPYIALEHVSTPTQTRVPPNTDYVAPPAGYNIFNANAGFAIQVKGKQLNLDFEVKNFTNTAYRDYLNHFRYYADELGINYVLRIKYSF